MEYPSSIRQERFADGLVQMFALVMVIISASSLTIGAALYSTPGLIVACLIYAICVMACFASSVSYHLLPYNNWRLLFRRLDHTAIYALIAGTFTPLLVHVNSIWGYTVLGMVWGLALPAMVYKMVSKEIEPWWSLGSYLFLGWIAILALPQLYERLPSGALSAMLFGGIIYTAGTYFYAKEVQPYRYAIWHSFVFLGTVFCFIAIWITVFH